MDELINTVSQKTGLPEDKARVAVDAVLNFVKSKLPESVAGQVDSAVTGESAKGSSVAERLGGILGKKSA